MPDVPAPTQRDRFLGAFLGLATGDALGTTLEFTVPGSFSPITDMVGGGPFHLRAGQWTDDTSMAICLAESLLAWGFDPADQMNRYLRWRDEGYWSSTGRCFDIGNTTALALSRFKRSGDAFSGPTTDYSAGNGSLMRLAPVPMYFANDPATAIRLAGESSRTTHGAPAAIDGCRYFAGLLVGALNGVSKDELLALRYSPAEEWWRVGALNPEIDAVAAGSFKENDPPVIRGTGHVVKCLEAALWAFHRTNDFRSGALAAVNLGEDADTTGAVYGQLAGAHYGVEAIPKEWRDRLTHVHVITRMAGALYDRACAGNEGR